MQSLVEFLFHGFEKLLTLERSSFYPLGEGVKHKLQLLLCSVVQIYLLSSVWRLHKSLLETRKPENALEISHWREAIRLWTRGLQQGFLQCFRSGQAPKQNAFQWGKPPPRLQSCRQKQWAFLWNIHGKGGVFCFIFSGLFSLWVGSDPASESLGPQAWTLCGEWRRWRGNFILKRKKKKPTLLELSFLLLGTATYWPVSSSI